MRLRTLSELVTQGNRLADVGTDHGYVPIYLLERGRIPSAIAMDINQGPLERAKEHIRQYGYEAYIETRRSDGLQALGEGEADTLLIAGMGGGLVQRILMEGSRVAQGIPEWILQPQSELYKMRRFLVEQGHGIAQEYMVYEDGKYYPILKVQPGKARALKEKDLPGRGCLHTDTEAIDTGGTCLAAGYTEAELYFGKTELQQNPDVLLACLERGIRVQEEILGNLHKAQGERSEDRRREVERQLEYMKGQKKQLLEE